MKGLFTSSTKPITTENFKSDCHKDKYQKKQLKFDEKITAKSFENYFSATIFKIKLNAFSEQIAILKQT